MTVASIRHSFVEILIFFGHILQLTEGSKYTAMVQHIDKDFAVISLDDTAQLTVIQTRSHLNDVFLSESEKMKPGMSLAVEVIEASCQEIQGLPLVSWERSAPKRQRTTSENQAGPKGLRFGDIVEGKVRAVKPTSILVTLEDGTTGSVHVSEVMEMTKVCPGSFPTSSVKVGSAVTARVIGGREASSRRSVPHLMNRFFFHCLFLFVTLFFFLTILLNLKLISSVFLSDSYRSLIPSLLTTYLSSHLYPGTYILQLVHLVQLVHQTLSWYMHSLYFISMSHHEIYVLPFSSDKLYEENYINIKIIYFFIIST